MLQAIARLFLRAQRLGEREARVGLAFRLQKVHNDIVVLLVLRRTSSDCYAPRGDDLRAVQFAHLWQLCC